MITHPSPLTITLLTIISLTGCDRTPTPAPSAAPPRQPASRPAQAWQQVSSTRPTSGRSDTAPARSTDEFNALDLHVPVEITAKIAELTGQDPFSSVAFQLQDMNGRPKIVPHGHVESHIDGPQGRWDYEFIVEEMTRSRTKGQAQYAGWITLRSDGTDYRSFFQATWADASPSTSPSKLTTSIPVKLVWLGPTVQAMRMDPTTRPTSQSVAPVRQ